MTEAETELINNAGHYELQWSKETYENSTLPVTANFVFVFNKERLN